MKDKNKKPTTEVHEQSPTEPHHSNVVQKPHDKKPMIWIIVAVVLAVALIGLAIFSYVKIKDLNKKLKDQQAQITDLSNKKKTLEDAASAAATAATNAAASAAANALASSNFVEVKELGFKLPVPNDLKDLQYFIHDKTVFFSTKTLMSSAWAADSGDASKYCAPGVLPLGAITRFANTTDAGPTQQNNLGAFVLGYAGPQANCSDNAATTSIQDRQKAELVTAFKAAQKL